jgi:hypothetical protein
LIAIVVHPPFKACDAAQPARRPPSVMFPMSG